MRKSGRVLTWLNHLLLLFLAVCIVYVVHELAHAGMYKALGYSPLINWKAGSVSAYDIAGDVIPRDTLPPQEQILISLAGPLVTLLLATGFAILYGKRKGSFFFFAIALMSAVYRFSMLIDGFNSDEGKAANAILNAYGSLGRMAGLTVPLIVWTTSTILTCILINRQSFFKRTYWTIPLWVVVNGMFTILLRLLTIAFL